MLRAIVHKMNCNFCKCIFILIAIWRMWFTAKPDERPDLSTGGFCISCRSLLFYFFILLLFYFFIPHPRLLFFGDCMESEYVHGNPTGITGREGPDSSWNICINAPASSKANTTDPFSSVASLSPPPPLCPSLERHVTSQWVLYDSATSPLCLTNLRLTRRLVYTSVFKKKNQIKQLSEK